MSDYSRSLDEHIRRAILGGEFDNLPGKGQPLDLTENPYEDPAWATAFRMLRSSGHTLPWIEKRQEIEAEFQAAKEMLARTWAWRELALAQNQSSLTVEEEWQRVRETFLQIIAGLNKRIFDYNLEVPANQFKRAPIDAGREIEKITTQAD